MATGNGFRRVAVLAALAGLGSIHGASAQVVERDTKITGPRGRSVERQIRTERRPGSIERDIRIQRPGGTFERDVRVENRGGGYRPGFGPGPRVVERDVVVERDYLFAPPPPPIGFGGPFLNFSFGSPPPPPVVVVPEPVYVQPAPAPNVIYQPPVRYAPPAPQTVVVDPVAAAAERLKSSHNHSRRDGALTLGRLGDNRAVPVLIERLEKDWEKEVRVAAAWALGEIGDPRAALALQKASLYDRKSEVKEAAAIAYRKLDRGPINDPNVQVPQPQPQPQPRGSTTVPDGEPSLLPPPIPQPDSPLPDAPR